MKKPNPFSLKTAKDQSRTTAAAAKLSHAPAHAPALPDVRHLRMSGSYSGISIALTAIEDRE